MSWLELKDSAGRKRPRVIPSSPLSLGISLNAADLKT